MLVKNSHESGEFKWMIDPGMGSPPPVTWSSERPLRVAVVFARVSTVTFRSLIVNVCAAAVRFRASDARTIKRRKGRGKVRDMK
jgi:hypothetical protein